MVVSQLRAFNKKYFWALKNMKDAITRTVHDISLEKNDRRQVTKSARHTYDVLSCHLNVAVSWSVQGHEFLVKKFLRRTISINHYQGRFGWQKDYSKHKLNTRSSHGKQ